MLNIIIGIISGIVSGMGMRWWNNTNTLFSTISWERSTYSTRCKSCIFCTNFDSFYNYKYKTKISGLENRNNGFNLWSDRCNYWCKCFSKFRHKSIKAIFWYIFIMHCCIWNLFYFFEKRKSKISIELSKKVIIILINFY